MYGRVLREHEGALEHRLRRDPMGDVDDLRVRRDPLDHAVAGPDEVVLEPEVGQERDEHGSRVYDARGARARAADGRDEPACRVSSASARTSSPAARAARGSPARW